MSFEFNKELNGWFLTTDDGFKAYYDFHSQKLVFCGKIVDSEGRKYTTDSNTKSATPKIYATYTEEKLVD